MSDIRVATTPTLLRLGALGEWHDFNRRTLPDDLDPDGRHILSMALPDHQRGRRDDPMHHRIMGLLKIEGDDQPFITYLDVTDESWRALPTVDEWNEMCKVCEGEGVVQPPDKNPSVATSREPDVRCPACGGTGKEEPVDG